jgi:hypothetical protein
MSRYAVILTSVCLGLSSTEALAQAASSSGYAVSANENVSAVGVVNATVNVGPIAPSSGSAPPAYNNSNSLASVNQSATLTSGIGGVSQSLSTGLLTSSASGTSTAAQGTGTINNLVLSLDSNVLGALLGVGATTIQSTSQANSVGGLDASGSTTIEGLTLYGLLLNGVTINGSLFVNPNPNTILLSIAGLTITLNEQTMLGDGITSTGISTNAIDVAFNNFALGTNLLNGNVILGHSQALASLGTPAVPEPSTWAMMLLGFAGIGFAARRRKAASLMQPA